MRAIIADDERHLALDLGRRLALLWPELQLAAVVHDGIAAAEALTELRPDIAFLDIRMPGKSGLEAAAHAPPECKVVFVTAYDEHAVQAFDEAAADYLLKPVSDERLTRCVGRLQKMSAPEELLSRLTALIGPKERPRYFRAQQGRELRMVAAEEICYLRSADKYTLLVTRDQELLMRTPLKELISELDPSEFWQVHRGTVVNARQIFSAQQDEAGKLWLVLRERAEKIPVSRSFAHLFK